MSDSVKEKTKVKKQHSSENGNSKSKKQSNDDKRIKELEKKIKLLEKENSELKEQENKFKDQLLRKMAEFDNYRKRTEKEFIDNIQSASKDVIIDLLPVIDDLERALNHAEDNDDHKTLSDGVKLVYKNFMNTLKKRGLEVMDVIGKEFNPDEHDALMQVDTDKFESGHIVEQHVKGYTLNDKVIRHAQVLVSK